MAGKTAKTDKETKKAASEKPAKAKKSAAPKASGNAWVSDYAKILRPVITEKSSIVGANNTMVFHVDPRSNKDEIRAAIERIFSVKVKAVKTVNYQGKPKRTSRGYTNTSGYKKAYVQLAEGSKINVVEGL